MRVQETRTIGYTTYATIIAEENEVLTKENIENKYFYPFGGHIQGMTKDIAHVVWYND